MAFIIAKLEPVKFGEVEEVPTITPELKMRLDILSLDSPSAIESAIETLSSAFPKHHKEIQEYLSSEQVPLFELSRLRAYLIGGEAAVASVDNSFNIAINKALEND